MTTRIILSSGRQVTTLEYEGSFLVIGNGSHGALGAPVYGPYQSDDKRFSPKGESNASCNSD